MSQSTPPGQEPPRTTSHAKSAAPAPDHFQSAPAMGEAFNKSRNAAQPPSQTKGSGMVANDRPKPVQRPSPALAHGVDACTFNARWEAERKAALADQDRAARKAAFMAARTNTSQTRTRARNR